MKFFSDKLTVCVCVLHRGVCQSCGTEVESIQLTEDEYTQLKHRVMNDVIEGRDVFNKTTPEVCFTSCIFCLSYFRTHTAEADGRELHMLLHTFSHSDMEKEMVNYLI